MHAIVPKTDDPSAQSDDTLESLGLPGATMMQLWGIGVTCISDLTEQNSDSLRKLFSESFDGSYGSKKRIEALIADLSSALAQRRKSLRPSSAQDKQASHQEDKGPRELPSGDTSEHELLDKMNSAVPNYAGDSMQGFYRDVRRHGILSREQQMELGRRVLENKDMAARNKLVVHNLRLVLALARKQLWATFARKKDWSALEYEDLVQEGMIGLMVAADKFDYRLGYAFSTYATWWIRQGMTRAIMDSGFIRIPVHLGELIYKVRRSSAEIAIRTGRTPTITEVAIAIECAPRQVKAALKVMRMQMASLDDPVGSNNGSTDQDTLLHEMIADSSALRADRILEAREELNDACTRINYLVEDLYADDSIDERNREIFIHFYGLEGSLKRRTLEHVAEKYDITRERIRQIIKTCWDKLQRDGTDMDHDSVVEELFRIGELEKLTSKRVSVE